MMFSINISSENYIKAEDINADVASKTSDGIEITIDKSIFKTNIITGI